MNLLRFLRDNRKSSGIALALLFAVSLATGWSFWPGAFFRGYWLALMFWTQLSIGAWIVLLTQHLTGGEWGRAIAPGLRAASFGFFLLLPLFIPPLLALPHIFPWTKIEPGVSAAVLVNKEPWLNSTAFIFRTIFYLAALTAMIALRRREILPRIAGPLLTFTIILFSFFSADWMMSLQPTFYSSLYPFLYYSGAMVVAFSLICAVAAQAQLQKGAQPQPKVLLDLGKLLFSAVLFWGYIVFAQFIIIWTGNLPDEAEWYVIRGEEPWLWITVFVLFAHFAIPFCLLLSQPLKKNPRRLFQVAAPLLVHYIEVFWLMRPSPGEGIRFSAFDIWMPLLFGLGWLWFVLGAREAQNFSMEATGET